MNTSPGRSRTLRAPTPLFTSAHGEPRSCRTWAPTRTTGSCGACGRAALGPSSTPKRSALSSVMNQRVGCTRGTLILGIKRYWIQLGTMTLSKAVAHFNARPAMAPPTPPYSGRGSRVSLSSHIPADIKCGDRPPHFVGRSPTPRRSPTVSQLPITIAPPQAAMEVRCISITTGAEDGASVTPLRQRRDLPEAVARAADAVPGGKDLCRYGIAATGQPAVYPNRRYGKYRFLHTADCPLP